MAGGIEPFSSAVRTLSFAGGDDLGAKPEFCENSMQQALDVVRFFFSTYSDGEAAGEIKLSLSNLPNPREHVDRLPDFEARRGGVR